MRVRVLPLAAIAAILFTATTASAAETCNGKEPTNNCRVNGVLGPCIGTDGADRIRGTRGPAVIIAGDGDDYIRGLTGDDTICGGGGNDTIRPGPGDDYVDGGPGDDKIYGSYGVDEILCGNGDDTADGGREEDTCGTGCERTSGCEESIEEGCASDTDCASGEFCHVASGECRAEGGSCTVDADCVNGQACNTATTTCTSCIDNDDDGYGVGCTLGVDCNDGNDAINPAATEVCDTVDNDCDGSTDEGFDLQTDANNCGACGTTCGGATPHCSLGTCHAASCPTGGDPTACRTFYGGGPCALCVSASPSPGDNIACNDASAGTDPSCSDGALNDDCAFNINSTGCADECCP